jgi:hypothetical protein
LSRKIFYIVRKSGYGDFMLKFGPSAQKRRRIFASSVDTEERNKSGMGD